MLAKNVSDAVGQVDRPGHRPGHHPGHRRAPTALAGSNKPTPRRRNPRSTANVGSVAVATSAANDFKARSADGPVVVHGDMTVLQQLRRDMGIDDFVFEDALFRGAEPGISAHPQVDAGSRLRRSPRFRRRHASFDPIRSAEVANGSRPRCWATGPRSSSGLRQKSGTCAPPKPLRRIGRAILGTSVDNLSPRALPARVGAWLAGLRHEAQGSRASQPTRSPGCVRELHSCSSRSAVASCGSGPGSFGWPELRRS